MTPELEAQIRGIIHDELTKALAIRLQPDRMTFEKNVQILDARNIQLGRTNGTKIGTASDQKVGFYGVTPIVRQGAITAPSGGGTGNSDAVDVSGRIAINALRAALTAIGITN